LEDGGLYFGAQQEVGLGDSLLTEAFEILILSVAGIRKVDDQAEDQQQGGEQGREQQCQF
jgi:hypothetical protein